MPESVSAPAPVFVSVLPVPLAITPLKVRGPVPPTVGVVEPSAIAPLSELVPVPVSAPLPPTPVPSSASASAPIATPLISSVAPAVTVVPAAVVPSAVAFVALSVPPATVVNPAYELAPENVSVPVFCLVTEPVPLITPPYVPVPAWSNTSAALSVMLPCRLVLSPCSVPVVIVVPPL